MKENVRKKAIVTVKHGGGSVVWRGAVAASCGSVVWRGAVLEKGLVHFRQKDSIMRKIR